MIVNVKKNTISFRYFVILLTFSCFFSCKTNEYYNYKVEGKKIGVTAEKGENTQIETFVAPYREHIKKDLDSVLAFSPETLDKSKFYHRDMKRKGKEEPELYANENDFLAESGIYDYIYLFKNDEWYVCTFRNKKFIKLTQEIIDRNKVIENNF